MATLVTSVSRRGGAPRVWTEARIVEELTDYLTGEGRMPTQLELRSAGRADLASAIGRYGGAAYWAQRLGLAFTERRGPYELSDDELVDQARQLIVSLGYLPGSTKLRQLDRPALAGAVIRAGGSRAFCRRHGLPYADGRTSVVRRRTR